MGKKSARENEWNESLHSMNENAKESADPQKSYKGTALRPMSGELISYTSQTNSFEFRIYSIRLYVSSQREVRKKGNERFRVRIESNGNEKELNFSAVTLTCYTSKIHW